MTSFSQFCLYCRKLLVFQSSSRSNKIELILLLTSSAPTNNDIWTITISWKGKARDKIWRRIVKSRIQCEPVYLHTYYTQFSTSTISGQLWTGFRDFLYLFLVIFRPDHSNANLVPVVIQRSTFFRIWMVRCTLYLSSIRSPFINNKHHMLKLTLLWWIAKKFLPYTRNPLSKFWHSSSDHKLSGSVSRK